MNIKASGRAALVIAAGLCLWFASPVQAAEEADGIAVSQAEAAPGAPVALGKFRKSRHWKHASSHRKPVKVAARISPERGKNPEPKISESRKGTDLALKDDIATPSLPSAVANAHAQLADAGGSADNAAALTSQARNRLQLMAANQSEPAPMAAPTSELVAADQLNEVDRTLSEAKTDDRAPAATPATPVAQAPAAAAASTDDSTWGQASLIGKIFIAFGGLLTLASAARMFMA